MSVFCPFPGTSHPGALPPGVHFSVSEVGGLCSGCLRSPEPGEMRGRGLCCASKTPGPDPALTKVLSTLWRRRKPLESRPGEPGRREPQWDEKSQQLSWSRRTSRETHPCPARARLGWRGDFGIRAEAEDRCPYPPRLGFSVLPDGDKGSEAGELCLEPHDCDVLADEIQPVRCQVLVLCQAELDVGNKGNDPLDVFPSH